MTGVFVALGHFPLLAVVLGTVLVVGLVLAWSGLDLAMLRRWAAIPAAMLIGVVVLSVLSAMGRWYFGPAVARSSRYVHIGAALTLPALAVAIDAIARRWRATHAAAARALTDRGAVERDSLPGRGLRSDIHGRSEKGDRKCGAPARSRTGSAGRAAAPRSVHGSRRRYRISARRQSRRQAHDPVETDVREPGERDAGATRRRPTRRSGAKSLPTRSRNARHQPRARHFARNRLTGVDHDTARH